MAINREDANRRLIAEIVDISSCSGGNMRGDGTCQLIPTNPPTGRREECIRYDCNLGPGNKSYYKPK